MSREKQQESSNNVVDQQLENHWRCLEKMYSLAPCNTVHKHSVQIPSYGIAHVSSPILPELFHAGDSMHGSTIFKILDDAAWFAAQSVNKDHFLVTTSFNTCIMKPVTMAHKNLPLVGHGKLLSASSNLIVAESELYCGTTLIAKGSGTFMKSPHKLGSMHRYTAYDRMKGEVQQQSKL